MPGQVLGGRVQNQVCAQGEHPARREGEGGRLGGKSGAMISEKPPTLSFYIPSPPWPGGPIPLDPCRHSLPPPPRVNRRGECAVDAHKCPLGVAELCDGRDVHAAQVRVCWGLGEEQCDLVGGQEKGWQIRRVGGQRTICAGDTVNRSSRGLVP